MNIAIGIDIGGTNTVWGFILESGEVLATDHYSTIAFRNPEDFVASVSDQIKQTLAQHPEWNVLGIGIGAPNGNYFNGTIEYAPNLVWGDGIIPLAASFEKALGTPTWLTNDANAAAIGEQIFGVAKEMKDFIVITLGTGLGSGFVVNGELMYGHDAFAGELGHTTIVRNGRLCGCGRCGCLETYVSATGIVRTAELWLKERSTPSLLRSVDSLDAAAITACAQQGDAFALELFDYTANQLGFALANTIALTSPEAIIFFGGLSRAGDLIVAPTKHYMEAYAQNIFQNKVKLLLSTVPEHHAAIMGAAALVWKNQAN